MSGPGIGVVVIGRNEGERLKASLASLRGIDHIVYVDSGSTDGSQDYARAQGVQVIGLPVPPKFTAARARNAGIEALLKAAPNLTKIQFVDGDCTVEPGWIETASAALNTDSRLGGVFGRRREVAPDRSLYNRICDVEWNVPIGPTLATGGDAMFRVDALKAVSGYDPSLIAGEEPDMCLRMGRQGWRFARIDAPMTRHDAQILRFDQWWRRAKRAGFAAASHVARHGKGSLPGDIGQVKRMIAWGGVLPLLFLILLLLGLADHRFALAALLVPLLLVAQWLRLSLGERRNMPNLSLAFKAGGLRVIHQFAAMAGLLSYWAGRMLGRDRGIIEYR
ncbi:MAG: glycosyltransferase family 2 protein [Sphingomonas sp.]|nr:glycosyltransferase family 2 protein [Sphingomonas sp.]